MGRVTVSRIYTAQGNSKYIEHKPQQIGHDNKHRLITQTVLWEAPYCLASLYHIHAQHDKSLPFAYNLASVVQRTGWSSNFILADIVSV